MSPSAPEGLIPGGPHPRGKRGSPSPAPGPLGGQWGAPGAALTVRATMPPRVPDAGGLRTPRGPGSLPIPRGRAPDPWVSPAPLRPP